MTPSPWDHFTDEELRCRCCGEMHMDQSFMNKLVMFREQMGFPFPVTSAFRCPKHNHEVSHSGFLGPHTTGKAVDIQVVGERAALLIRGALNNGFMGVGIRQHGDVHKRIVHLDMMPRPFQQIWTYPK